MSPSPQMPPRNQAAGALQQPKPVHMQPSSLQTMQPPAFQPMGTFSCSCRERLSGGTDKLKLSIDPSQPHADTEMSLRGGSHHDRRCCGIPCNGSFCFIPCPIPINCCIIPL